MKKIFNIQNRIVARADKTMDEANVKIELSVHMLTVTPARVGRTSSVEANPVEAVIAYEATEPVTAPGASRA
jgi:hypothetical protein